MDKQFKVGQVWKRRSGENAKIEAVDQDGPYPVYCTMGYNYTTDGLYLEGDTDAKDLIELISEAPSEDPAPELVPEPAPQHLDEASHDTPTFAVGQVWARRDDRTVRVSIVEDERSKSALVILCEDGHWRTRSGRISDSIEHPFDLVQLLPVTEPSAPDIADAMLDDAVGMLKEIPPFASQHNAEAQQAEGEGLRPMDYGDFQLFDNLMLEAARLGDFRTHGCEAALEAAKKIIAARRAL